MTTGVVAPQLGGAGFLAGLSTAFVSGAAHKLERGAVVQDVVALHVAIGPYGIPSVSTQVAALRHILISSGETGELYHWVGKVREVNP